MAIRRPSQAHQVKHVVMLLLFSTILLSLSVHYYYNTFLSSLWKPQKIDKKVKKITQSITIPEGYRNNISNSPETSKGRVTVVGSSWIAPDVQQFLLACGDEKSLGRSLPIEQTKWINLDCNTSALLVTHGIAPAHQHVNFVQNVQNVRDSVPKWTECADGACGTHWTFVESEQKPFHLRCNGYVPQILKALSHDNSGTAQYTISRRAERKNQLITFDKFLTKQQPHPQLMELSGWVREQVLKNRSIDPLGPCNDCILIIQRRHRYRRMAGSTTGTFTEIVTALVDEGYNVKIVVLEDLSGPEQVKLFGQARTVVAVHGAALTNLIWMPPGSKVVEITVEYGWGALYDHETQECQHVCDPYYKADYYNLARFFGHSYRNVTAVFHTPFEKGYFDDGNPIKRHIYYVDTKQILHALR